MTVSTRAQLGLTVADSTPSPPRDPKPVAGAPNVVVVVLDDMGFGQLGCYGSDIATPNIDRLAAGGVRYNRFHVTALCSPTRASLLTGRNHHAVGVGFLVDVPIAFPGYTGRIPESAATLPRILRGAGYNTMAVGKWHLVPGGERSPAGPYDRWPLGLGFERYYGFPQGDANHWAPNLVSDNHYVDPPRSPEEGYHLSEDLAERAIAMILDQKHAAPTKPFFMYLALGAMHAPHHVTPEWVAPYQGRFDAGWERWREQTFARQLDLGVVPSGTTLTERPPWVTAWGDLTPDARRMHTRAHEVYAGFLTHTDAQIGRVVDALHDIGELDNTLILLMSDNGASAEGGQHGTFNEHRFSARIPESVEGNLAHYDDWGGHSSYSHYSWGWAWAGNTPFRLWKRYTWLGGTRTPLIAHWPSGIQSPGTVRSQFCHVVDLMPTVLDACQVDSPDVVAGVTQQPIDGFSLAPNFADPDTPDIPRNQYFEMLGSRSIVSGRWKATTDHVSQGVVDEEQMMTGSRDFAQDHWALFDLEDDFSESEDVSSTHPDVVRRLSDLWLIEAGRNNVMPMCEGLTSWGQAVLRPQYPPAPKATFRPGGSSISDQSVPVLAFGFTISAEVDISPPAEGVVFALGDWNGGYGLYAIEGILHFAYVPAGEAIHVKASNQLPIGRHHISVSFKPGPGGGGEFSLHCDDDLMASTLISAPVGFPMQHGGTHLRLGSDIGIPVSGDYTPPFPWNGSIHEITVDTPGMPGATNADIRSALHSD